MSTGREAEIPLDSTAPRWELTYEVTARDIRRFASFHCWHVSRRCPLLLVMYLLTITIAPGVAYFTPNPGVTPAESAWASFWALAIILGLALAISFVVHPWRSVLGTRTMGGLGFVTVRISREALVTQRPGIEGRRLWSSIHRIAASKEAIYLYLNPLQMIGVPIRAFSSPQEAETCLAAMREWREAERAKKAD